MAKTTQCMKMNVLGVSYVCTFTPGRKSNPYQLYRTWWDYGTKRKKVVEYQNFESVLYFLLQQQHPEFIRDYFPACN